MAKRPEYESMVFTTDSNVHAADIERLLCDAGKLGWEHVSSTAIHHAGTLFKMIHFLKRIK